MSHSSRRVAVTGMGIISPLGIGIEPVWRRLLNGESGIGRIQSFETGDMVAKIAAQVPRAEGASFAFNPDEWVTAKERQHLDDFIIYALAAAQQAVHDCGWTPANEEEADRAGVIIGSAIGGINTINTSALTLKDNGPRRILPFSLPSTLVNLASGTAAIRFGYKGPTAAIVTACASGAHSIGYAAQLIMLDQADVMLCGGSEAAVCRLSMSGFASMRALSTHFNDRPVEASRPWDKDRDGFVMGEGAGILILEELEHAKKRGAHIYAEIVGFGLSGDACHIAAPSENGDGPYRAMKGALRHAGLTPEDINYINAHGTSTPRGDEVEIAAIKRLFGDSVSNVLTSSTKSATGHLLGAAGAVEAIFSILAIRDKVAPPTLNLENPSAGCDIDLVPKQAKEHAIKRVLSNSFGFGGQNASLIFATPT